MELEGQTSFDDILFGNRPKKEIHPSKNYVNYLCKHCGRLVGMTDKTNMFIYKAEICKCGFPVDW